MWGNKSPTPPVFRPKGRGIKKKEKNKQKQFFYEAETSVIFTYYFFYYFQGLFLIYLEIMLIAFDLLHIYNFPDFLFYIISKKLPHLILIKNPRSKLRGIEDFSLKYLRYVGEQIPHTPSFPPQGAGY
jgi:hypothetical protein